MKQRDILTKLAPTGGAILSNCFTRFPLEILEYIIAHLPTDEVKTLSRTLEELAMIFHPTWDNHFGSPDSELLSSSMLSSKGSTGERFTSEC